MSIFHLKYRPQRIDDLDLKEVSEKIRNVLKQKNESMSLLLSGPKGSGKTSAARIISRAINCLSPEGVEPCNRCQNCLEIQRGGSMDIVEIDAASNRGIEDIRNLKAGIYLAPTKLSKKVIIVDEVHMLTKEAFNAFLKMLEEPPKDTCFILCTTDENKIPETVLSRLIKIEFYKGKKEELSGSLRKVIEGEKLDVEDGVVDMMVGESDGSFRNLQRNFNEIVMNFGKKIRKKDIEEWWEKKSGYSGEELETDLVAKDKMKILKKIEKLSEKGINFSDLRQSWLSFFQKRMLGFYGSEKLSGEMDLPSIYQWIEKLLEVGNWEKMTDIGQLPLEMAVVEFLGISGEREETVKKIEEVAADGAEEIVKEVVIKDEELETRWGEVLLAVKPFNHSVEAFLRAARPSGFDKKGNLILDVFYKFHKERLEEAKNREIVEKGLEKVLGKKCQFECRLQPQNKKVVNKEIEKKEDGVVVDGDVTEAALKIFS